MCALVGSAGASGASTKDTAAGAGGAVEPVAVEAVRLWPAPDHTRVVLDLSGPVGHDLFTLDNPPRVVVDLRNARLTGALPKVGAKARERLRGVRAAPRHESNLRVVLDLTEQKRPRSFLLPPAEHYGYRLVLDLYDAAATEAAEKDPPLRAPKRGSRAVVVLDPGHGGEDPGASGRRGTREKHVVLKIAKEVAKRVDAHPGMTAVLTRSGDYYVPLRKRMRLARDAGADIFVSIHADAFRKRDVRGSSVYVVSRGGASSEAAHWLAMRENASELVGGVSLGDKPDSVRQMILDLSQSATMRASESAAREMVTALGGRLRLHKRGVEHAPFMVLKAPDIPSMLIETAFISNPDDERALRDPKQRARMADAIFDGIRRYFAAHPPEGTLLAARRHRIESGDTLSGIAARYGVSVPSLRELNGLRGTTIRVGQMLTIPPRG